MPDIKIVGQLEDEVVRVYPQNDKANDALFSITDWNTDKGGFISMFTDEAVKVGARLEQMGLVVEWE